MLIFSKLCFILGLNKSLIKKIGGDVMKSAEIKDRIKIAMEIRDIKQSELVEKTGIDKGQLSSYISGRYKPKQINIQLIADALSVDEAWLMGYDVPMEGELSLEQIITNQIKKQGISLEEVAKKANVSYDWLKDIDSFSPSLEPPFGEPDLSSGKPLEWDDESYTYDSYGCISRVAKVIGLPPGMLRAALARQEIPLPEEHSHIPAREAFSSPYAEPTNTDKDGSIRPSPKEQDVIIKYRSLDTIGQNHVESVLDWETDRVQQIQRKDSRIYELETANNTIYPYLGKIACAGTGFYFDDIPTDTIEAPYVDGADFIIGVSGESMEPDYHDGEKLYVRKVEYLRHGDVGIFTIENECFLKELGENGLISRNKDYDDIPGDEKVRLVGKVIGKVDES